jgi:polyisoprenyl-teichoic acid--peptidoglycan teichoic acid transferase
MDGISRRTAPPVVPRRRLDGGAVERLRTPAVPVQTATALPSPAPVAKPLVPIQAQPRPAKTGPQTTPRLKAIPHPRRSIGELAKAVVATEAVHPNPPKTVVPARHLPPIDMELPGEDSPLRRIDSLLQHGKLATFRRWTFRGAIAMLVLLIGAGGLLFYNNLHKAFKGGTTTAAALRTDVNPSLLKGEGDGRINVLLMGRGGGGHDAPDLTDSMMLASIDPVNHTSTLISIPRDLWVDVPNQGAMKINAAWESGEFKYLNKVAPGSTDSNAIKAGFAQADQTVENVLGVTIHYNVLLSFQAFQQAVDSVGGVTVNAPADLVDQTMAWENGNSSLLAKAGVNNLNGKQALNYVRSRETSSDFARAQRQRAVLVALKGKINTLGTLSNPLKLSGLMNTFGNNVQTDLSVKDASRLYSIIKKIPDTKTTSLGLSDPPNNYFNTGTLAGQSITLPTAGLFNYKDIQSFVRTQLKDPYITKENARIAILNGTATPGLAAAKSDQLKTYGYNVISAGNAPNTNWLQTTLVDVTRGKDKYTKRYLEQRLGVTATTKLPDSTIQANGADFVIIIGSNEATPTQN